MKMEVRANRRPTAMATRRRCGSSWQLTAAPPALIFFFDYGFKKSDARRELVLGFTLFFTILHINLLQLYTIWSRLRRNRANSWRTATPTATPIAREEFPWLQVLTLKSMKNMLVDSNITRRGKNGNNVCSPLIFLLFKLTCSNNDANSGSKTRQKFNLS
jgi:hypothetical protein